MGAPLRKSPGVPERRGRRGTAPIAVDRIPFQRPELPPTTAIVARNEILAGRRRLAARIALTGRSISLPLAHSLTDDEVARIAAVATAAA